MRGGAKARSWIPRLSAAAAVLMAAAVYLNALDNPFVYDDHRVVLQNVSIRDLANVRALLLHDRFRPVVNISYAIDYAWAGIEPFGYHLTSVLLHAVNVLLLFVLARWLMLDAQTLRASWAPAPASASAERGKTAAAKRAATGPGQSSGADAAAFAAAAVWAVHPLMTQAVGYVSGRSEVLCALFCLASLLCIRTWFSGRRGWWLALGVACWTFALASKEVAAMLPVVLLVWEKLLRPQGTAGSRRSLARVSVPMLAVVAVAGAARLVVFAGVENIGRASFSWGNVAVGVGVILQYVSLMFLAAPQAIFHSAQTMTAPLRQPVLLDALEAVTAAVFAWRAYRRAPLVTFGAVWFVLMLLPSVLMLTLDIGEPMAEQRAYLAGGGFALASGAAFAFLWDWLPSPRVSARVVAATALGVLLVVLASRTLTRNEVWSDPVRLWREAVVEAPDVWLPHRGLGDVLRERGDSAGAIAAYREAARLRPEEANTHLALGVSLLMAGQLPDADRSLAEAARLSPGMEQAETARGLIARASGRRDEARDRFLAVVRAHPRAVIARQYLAEMYEQDYQDPASALRLCREVQALAPQAEGVNECIQRNQRRISEGARGPG